MVPVLVSVPERQFRSERTAVAAIACDWAAISIAVTEKNLHQGDTERVGGRGSNSLRTSTVFLRTPPFLRSQLPPSEEAATSCSAY